MSASDEFSRQKDSMCRACQGKCLPQEKGWENSFLCEGASETHRRGQGM